jgi:3-oxoacyl-[acyl-carrier-protein] synthase-3
MRPTPCIAAVGTLLPGKPVDNAAMNRHFGISESWVDAFVGTRTRHLAVDLSTGTPTHTLADMCTEAAALAMARADVQARDVDFVVMATASPDELMPATVNRVAGRLGVDHVPTYQLQSGCAGAVQALDLGCLLLAGGGHRTGLVIGGDVCVKHLRLDRDFLALPTSELVNYALFGDGAGAAVLTADGQPGGMAVRHVLNQLAGIGREPGQIIRWFGEGDRAGGEQAVVEDYKAIEERVPQLAEEILWQLLDATGWARDDVAYLLPPQLAGRMTAKIFNLLDDGRVKQVSCVADTGNNGNALPFSQLEILADRLGPGEKALAISVESSKWIKAGFALEGL